MLGVGTMLAGFWLTALFLAPKRLRRFFSDIDPHVCFAVLSAPLFWLGLRHYFRPQFSPVVARAEYAAIVWWQRRLGWSGLSDLSAILFFLAYFVTGFVLLLILALSLLHLFGYAFPFLRSVTLPLFLSLPIFAIIVQRNYTKNRSITVYRSNRIKAFLYIPRYSVLETVVLLLIFPLPIMVFAFGLLGYPTSPFASGPSPVWPMVGALISYWLFAWWTQFAIWFFAHPRHGLLRPRCHWPLRFAAARGRIPHQPDRYHR